MKHMLLQINQALRIVVRHLRGNKFFYPSTFSSHTANFDRSTQIVRVYYAICFGMGLYYSGGLWPQLAHSQFAGPLWPFFNLHPAFIQKLVPFAFCSWIFGSLFAAVNPNLRSARVSSGLGLFFVVAMFNSDMHFAHNYYALVWISLVFMFFPSSRISSGPTARRQRHSHIQVFWTAQFLICLFYMMTGIWKVRAIMECAIWSEYWRCEMSTKILTNMAAHEHVFYRKFAPLTWILFEHPVIGFVSYMGVIWIHLFSVHFAFRPSLHAFFGFLRVFFHLGTLVLFGVNFAPFTTAIIAIFLFSPFHSADRPLWKVLCELPPFDSIYRFISLRFSFRAR